MIDIAPVLAWLANDPPTDSAALIDGLVAKLAFAGVAIERVRVGTPRLHPETAGSAIDWDPGEPAKTRTVSHTFVDEARRRMTTAGAPISRIMAGESEIRCRLTATVGVDMTGLGELYDAGFRDYYILALPQRTAHGGFTAAFISVATQRPSGFAEEELEALRAIKPLLGLRLALSSAHAATQGCLDVYLGQNASARILAGDFKRGSGEIISAVIWFCDLRGFTGLADNLPVMDVVQLLDQHFDRIAKPVTAAGGEILKFIGDAVLAIFPVGADPTDACRRALDSAKLALAAVAESDLQAGVALHLGEVLYGNIGASNRLDFTVIGRAVNEVCRAEALCKETKVPLLTTAAFARALGGNALVRVGTFTLRGVAEPVELHTLPELVAR